MKVLIIDDEIDLNNVLAKRFKLNGYEVRQAFNGLDGLRLLDEDTFDCVILDVMMPKLDGFATIQRMREEGNNTPVIFLTAKDADSNVIQGLNLGADDYIIKPFSFDVLFARVKAITRRTDKIKTQIIQIHGLTINQDTHEVMKNKINIELSNKEYEMLLYLAKNKNTVVTREKLEFALYGYDSFTDSNVIDVHIRHLRNKIEESKEDKIIQTVRGVGYMLKD